MARQKPILLDTFTADTVVPTANVCLVYSAVNPGNVRLPAAALAAKFAGVAVEPSQSSVDATRPNVLPLMTDGVVQVQTDGSAVITAGDYLAIANALGQVKSVVPATGAVLRQVVGIAKNSVAATVGLLVDMKIEPTIYIGA